MENSMLKMQIAVGLAAAALMAGTVLAQTAAPTRPAGPGQVMTQMPPDLMRGSRFIGLDVYGADNQKIGDVDELLVDRQGKVHGLVVGVGGFLGIGQKNVAIPFDQLQWMSLLTWRPTKTAMARTLQAARQC
jgi:sporulation protein YlmC with PRC-barrel domain